MLRKFTFPWQDVIVPESNILVDLIILMNDHSMQNSRNSVY